MPNIDPKFRDTFTMDPRAHGGGDVVRQMLAEQVTAAVADRDALLAQRAELICEVETMRARCNAWRETARMGVRLVEHITVTQSTDGQWKNIAELYEWFDNLHDAEADEAAPAEYEYQTAMAAQARRQAVGKNWRVPDPAAYSIANQFKGQGEPSVTPPEFYGAPLKATRAEADAARWRPAVDRSGRVREYPNPASSQEDQDNQTGIPR